MGGHQDEDVLQENEGVVNWHGQENSSQESSEEEVSWLNKSPSRLLIDLQNEGVEGGFSSLDLHDLESLANNKHKEGWNNN